MSGMKFQSGNNFYFCPIGYTGRCSALLTSGTNVRRPKGVFINPETGNPEYQASKRLDYELEMAYFLSKPLPYGQTIKPDEAEEHIFGFVLMNDWSARDIQMYESVPVGPIHSKSFGTSISPWVVTTEALSFARARPQNQQDGAVPAHMQHSSLENQTYDITCHAYLVRVGKGSSKLSESNVKHMYYTPGQLAAHRSSSGCGLVTGELIGMGTVSSGKEVWPDRSLARAGCLFEMTWNNTRELRGVGGKFLEDGDTVRLEAWANGANHVRIGFGDVVATIKPAA